MARIRGLPRPLARHPHRKGATGISSLASSPRNLVKASPSVVKFADGGPTDYYMSRYLAAPALSAEPITEYLTNLNRAITTPVSYGALGGAGGAGGAGGFGGGAGGGGWAMPGDFPVTGGGIGGFGGGAGGGGGGLLGTLAGIGGTAGGIANFIKNNPALVAKVKDIFRQPESTTINTIDPAIAAAVPTATSLFGPSSPLVRKGEVGAEEITPESIDPAIAAAFPTATSLFGPSSPFARKGEVGAEEITPEPINPAITTAFPSATSLFGPSSPLIKKGLVSVEEIPTDPYKGTYGNLGSIASTGISNLIASTLGAAAPSGVAVIPQTLAGESLLPASMTGEAALSGAGAGGGGISGLVDRLTVPRGPSATNPLGVSKLGNAAATAIASILASKAIGAGRGGQIGGALGGFFGPAGAIAGTLAGEMLFPTKHLLEITDPLTGQAGAVTEGTPYFEAVSKYLTSGSQVPEYMRGMTAGAGISPGGGANMQSMLGGDYLTQYLKPTYAAQQPEQSYIEGKAPIEWLAEQYIKTGGDPSKIPPEVQRFIQSRAAAPAATPPRAVASLPDLSAYDVGPSLQMPDEIEYPRPGYARGGLASLPEYKAGGKFLRGPGDGMSDSIRANINGKQEARLADGEFVIPADVVSHLGNGSSEAGSRKLYAMMNKIRRARTGRKKQAPKVNPDKFLPSSRR